MQHVAFKTKILQYVSFELEYDIVQWTIQCETYTNDAKKYSDLD